MIKTEDFKNKLQELENKLKPGIVFKISGKIITSIGLTLEARGITVPVGTLCKIMLHTEEIDAIVTGFNQDKTYLMPMDNISGIAVGTEVYSTNHPPKVQLSNHLLGRIIDGAGRALDNKGAIATDTLRSLYAANINPLDRQPIRSPLDVGVKAINGLLTVGEGQRLGLFAGSGVGKSVLLGMIARFTEADVVVIALIGERGREVKEFIEDNLGTAITKAVVVASPADYSPMLRLQGALRAMTVAEFFRDQGKKVLVLFDSLTRFAQAQREIGLATGEMPATRGYPPSAFSILPQLVERAGKAKDNGSITAIFTVLAEGDDLQDPIADASRAILDGHIVLSRRLVERGHYPAIDIEASISRVMQNVVNKDLLTAVRKFKKNYALYRENEDIFNMGAYSVGNNAELDEAIKLKPHLDKFLMQNMDEKVSLTDAQGLLLKLCQT